MLLCACTKTITIEVEGTGRVGEKVRHGPGEIGTIEAVGDTDEVGLTRLSVVVDDEFIIPQGACGYTIGDAVFIRGGTHEPTETFIPHCEQGAASVDRVFEEFFDDIDDQAEHGADFRDQVRRVIEPHAHMVRLDVPELKPDSTEPED